MNPKYFAYFRNSLRFLQAFSTEPQENRAQFAHNVPFNQVSLLSNTDKEGLARRRRYEMRRFICRPGRCSAPMNSRQAANGLRDSA
jgi:hypothetical protein